MMRTNILEKLSNIVKEIDNHGSASLTRLTVLKRWFERTERLSAFAIWIATRAVSRQGKTRGGAAKLLRKARGMLAGLDKLHPQLDRQMAQTMHARLRVFQNEYRYQKWGAARIVHNWNLMLVEHGLDIYLWHLDSPTYGYRLAADYCQHYDSRYGSGLIGPSRTKIQQLVRFLSTIEALEDVSK
jgi:hypothetical protein